jgi:hypothetical protein
VTDRVQPPPGNDPENAWLREAVPIELARRIAVAWLSYQMGIKSMDYFRRTYMSVDGTIGDLWYVIAAQVMQMVRGGARPPSASP